MEKDSMKNVRSLVAGLGVGLCLCAVAKADDDEIQAMARPVVVKRVILFTGHPDRVIYVRPAFPVHSVVPVTPSTSPTSSMTPTRTRRHGSETPTVNRESSINVVRTTRSNHGETNQTEQKADKDSRPADTNRKTDAKQPEDDDALDQLTAQAQKEQELRLAEPGGIEHR
jgi:hypothetical protein